MNYCKICGKKIPNNYTYCLTCYKEKDNQEKEIQKPGYRPYKFAKPTLGESGGIEHLYNSKEEEKIAKYLSELGYFFETDQNYPYHENTTKKKYDFMILNKKKEDYEKKIFIEVKKDSKDHAEEMLEKQEMVLLNGDQFVYINNCKDKKELEEKINKAKSKLMKNKRF
jgi:hypothetical protein